MYGDTTAIRRLARQVSEQAGDIRADADQLVTASRLVVWDGQAATAMRGRMAERAIALRRTADEHDEAAAALRRHATEVDRLTDLIADVAARVAALVEAARSRLADLADRTVDTVRSAVPDPSDEVLAGFASPPDGHRDWLDVADRLPGAGR